MKFLKEKRTLRIEPFSKIYSKNCTCLFWKKKSKNWTLFFSMWPKELNFFSVWLKELSPFKKYYSMNWIFFFFFSILLKDLSLFSHNMTFKNWTFLKNMTQRIEPFFEHDSQKLFWVIIIQRIVLSKNMTHKTQRIEPSFHKWLEDLNFLFQICLIETTFFFFEKRWLEELIFWKYQSNYTNFILTQRIELFFLKNMTHRNWTLFWNFTQWIEPSPQKDSKNSTLKDYLNNKTFLWIGELGFFFLFDSKNWTFSQKYHSKIIDLFWHDSQNRTPF